MNRTLNFFLISIFSIFLGSQITEGFLLVPHWQSLSAVQFYDYYARFGPAINQFYTFLTLTAVLIPIGVALYSIVKKSRALTFSCLSTLFAILILALFYVYFKDVNLQFYESTFDEKELKSVLKTWENYHWLRVLFESLSLLFLVLTTNILSQESNT